MLQSIKATGQLYMMGTLSEGSNFSLRFASLENGKLSIFKNESDYLNFNSTIGKPFDLHQYRLVTSAREVEATSMAPGSKLTGSLARDAPLSVRKNWQNMLLKYRFNLVPKVIYFFFSQYI